MLEMNGHRVVGGAYNGNECLEVFGECEEEPDFVIMDHQMPIKNGLETMKELLKINPKLKIIFISGDRSIKNEALALGAATFIEKPIDTHHLFKSINDLSFD